MNLRYIWSETTRLGSWRTGVLLHLNLGRKLNMDAIINFKGQL